VTYVSEILVRCLGKVSLQRPIHPCCLPPPVPFQPFYDFLQHIIDEIESVHRWQLCKIRAPPQKVMQTVPKSLLINECCPGVAHFFSSIHLDELLIYS